jgi:hypothetical protein
VQVEWTSALDTDRQIRASDSPPNPLTQTTLCRSGASRYAPAPRTFYYTRTSKSTALIGDLVKYISQESNPKAFGAVPFCYNNSHSNPFL